MSNLLFIIAAPSGAGKTSLVRRLLLRVPDIFLSISTTTRPPRPGEADGREYHFTDEASFLSRVEEGDFLEWAQVHGNYYGTSRSRIEEVQGQGRDILLEIDWQGAALVRKAMPGTVGIFILPPSLESLSSRLNGRGTDSAEVIARRIANAREEMRHATEFEYVIINDVLEDALEDLTSIVRAERLGFARQHRQHKNLFAALGISDVCSEIC